MANPITIAMAAGTALDVASRIQGGNAANKAAKEEAAQLNSNANEAFATGTRRSYEAGKQSESFASDMVAAQAASGGVSNDPQALRQRAKAEAQGEYNVLAELYQGEVKRQDLRKQAQTRRIEGKNAKKAGMLKGVGTALGGLAQFR